MGVWDVYGMEDVFFGKRCDVRLKHVRSCGLYNRHILLFTENDLYDFSSNHVVGIVHDAFTSSSSSSNIMTCIDQSASVSKPFGTGHDRSVSDVVSIGRK